MDPGLQQLVVQMRHHAQFKQSAVFQKVIGRLHTDTVRHIFRHLQQREPKLVRPRYHFLRQHGHIFSGFQNQRSDPSFYKRADQLRPLRSVAAEGIAGRKQDLAAPHPAECVGHFNNICLTDLFIKPCLPSEEPCLPQRRFFHHVPQRYDFCHAIPPHAFDALIITGTPRLVNEHPAAAANKDPAPVFRGGILRYRFIIPQKRMRITATSARVAFACGRSCPLEP